MRRYLPPLTAIRAFEAATRHMSFSAAARELCVSASAVSQQIKILESHLGVQLFERDPARGLKITAAGRVCAPALQSILDSLSHVFAQVHANHEEQIVTLLLSPSLMGTWLAPRLRSFEALHPDINVRVWINRGLHPAQNRVEHDLAIYYGEGPFQDRRVDLLMTESVFPVCSPSLLQRHPIKVAGDLRAHALLHDDTLVWERNASTLGFPDWSAWLSFAGVTGLDSARGHRVQVSSSVLDFAAEGVGVALARSCIAQRDLDRGRLVRPLALEYPRRFPYYVVCNPLALSRLAVSQLRNWLIDEGRATERASQAHERRVSSVHAVG